MAYEHREFHGKRYVNYGEIGDFTTYLSEDIPEKTREKVADFLNEKGRDWMREHIGSNHNKHFRRADRGIDEHWYMMEHPTGSEEVVLVDRRT